NVAIAHEGSLLVRHQRCASEPGEHIQSIVSDGESHDRRLKLVGPGGFRKRRHQSGEDIDLSQTVVGAHRLGLVRSRKWNLQHPDPKYTSWLTRQRRSIKR